MKLQEGDIWLSEKTNPDGRPYRGIYFLRVRAWRKRAWRDNGISWSLLQLRDQNENKGLLKVENRPSLATYTGIYRYQQENSHEATK